MRITLPRPDDWHVHLRQKEQSADFARVHAQSFGRILAMPNTLPPLVTPGDIESYRKEAGSASPGLEILAAFRLMPGSSADDVMRLADAGVPAGKYYPDGATTNSSGGLSDWRRIGGALGAMEERGMVLCVHGEDPSVPVLDREEAFIPVFREIRKEFPGLKMILEHVSTAAGAAMVADDPGPTAATVTVQHLFYTLDDLIGASMNPHLFCKPVVKSARHRAAIREMVLSGSPRFFFGSDSAPHPRILKESGVCPAGCYTSPMALPALASWFEREGALEQLQPFLCDFGRGFYGVGANRGEIVLERREWTVPGMSLGCVPLMAGETLPWRVAGISA